MDRVHYLPGSPYAAPDPARLEAAQRRMRYAPRVLDVRQRETALGAIRQTCAYRGWTLLAAHVRTNHVHVVVDAAIAPERVMHDLKSYATRALVGARRWTRHGSTRYLWTQESVDQAARYVVGNQGEAMAVFINTAPWRHRFPSRESDRAVP